MSMTFVGGDGRCFGSTDTDSSNGKSKRPEEKFVVPVDEEQGPCVIVVEMSEAPFE